MSGEYDAFGRAKSESADPVPPRPVAPAPAAAAHRAASADRAAPPRRRRGGWGLALLLLVGGGAAITGTLQAAVDGSEGQPQAVSFTLRKNPFAAPSLLRAAPLRRALARVERDVRPGERVVGLSVFPDRATVTVIDERDQQRWIIAGAAGQLAGMSLSSGSGEGDIDLGALDLDPVARYAARKYRALKPYARDPSFSLLRTQETDGPAGWLVRFSGVRQADSAWPIDLAGRPR